jgi:Ca2+:H+ antiporter
MEGGSARALFRPRLEWLLVFVPISLLSDLVFHLDLLTFLTSAAAIPPLAGMIGRSTDQLALHAGPRIGGLLNATFGNVTELIIAIFLILENEIEIVKASLTGSIIGNLLLVLGLSLFVGGLRNKEQTFSAPAASVHTSSLALAVAGLVMPAVFALTTGKHDEVQREIVSGVVAGVLMALYVCVLVFMLVTHEHLFRTGEPDEVPTWSVRRAVFTLLVVTAVVALESEILVGALEPALEDLGLSRLFVGLILVPIVGNAAEHSTAVLFAMRNKVDVTLEIAIGSSLQIALFVGPALVFISLIVGHPMDFVFSPFEVASVAVSVLLVALISRDGRSNWLEGLQLMATYVIIAMSFFFVRDLPGG